MVDVRLASLDGLELKRDVPDRLVLLRLPEKRVNAGLINKRRITYRGVAGSEEAVLSELQALGSLLDGQDWEADLVRPVEHEASDVATGGLRDTGPQISSDGVSVEVSLEVDGPADDSSAAFNARNGNVETHTPRRKVSCPIRFASILKTEAPFEYDTASKIC